MNRFVLVVVSVTALGSVPGCDRASGAKAPKAVASAVVRPVKVAVPKVVRTGQDRWTPGMLEPYEKVVLRANARGYMTRISVDMGDRFRKGKVLARLSIPEMSRDLDVLKGKIAEAKARVSYATAQRDYQALIAKRLAQVQRQAPDAVALHEVEKARSALVVREAALGVARAKVEARKTELARGKTLMRYTVLRAPWKGAVFKRHVHPGALLDRGKPVLTLVRAGPLRLAVDIPEPDVPFVKVGGAVRIELDAYPGKSFTAKIARRSPALDPGSHTLRVEVKVPNKDGRLAAGMYCRVRLSLEAPRQRLVIQPEALLHEKGEYHVFVVEDGKARRRRVVRGMDTGGTVEIRKGLKPTDRIVVRGNAGLRDGDPVLVPGSGGK